MIDTWAEYNYAQERGYEPLTDARLPMAPAFRVEVQRSLFGRGHTPEENERFYRWCWEHKPHVCEECLRPLRHYSAVHISHILTRGAHPDMAHDPRNVNVLCLEHHRAWENGKRAAMRIYEKNQLTIQQLKQEYL